MPEKKRSVKILCLHVFLILPLLFGIYYLTLAPKEWKGVDEAVVEKVASEHGREARGPLIDPGRGDLLLFVFLLAGVGAGFAAGYYWRTLTDRKSNETGSAPHV